MSTYLLIVIAVVAFPLLLSFEKRIQYWKKLVTVGYAMLWIMPLFIAWDMVAVFRQDWSFNPNYLLGVSWMRLPLEELLFFFAVPYSCLFIYEVVAYFVPEKETGRAQYVMAVLTLIFLAVGICSPGKPYTRTVFFIATLVNVIGLIFPRYIFASFNYWLYLLFSTLFFVIVEYFLTALPVFIYNNSAIIGWRLLTIPIEDFVYNYAMQTLVVLAYCFIRKRI